MPDQAHILRLDEGLEVFVFEGTAGVRLDSYRRAFNSSSTLKIGLWPKEPSIAYRDKRFATIDELVAALRIELGL